MFIKLFRAINTMKNNNNAKKEDIAGQPIYRQIARHMFASLHDNLMEELYRYFLNRNPEQKNTLLVIGQGPEVEPFSRNLDVVEDMVGSGNIAMVDYNPDIIESSIDALVNPRFDADEVVPEQKTIGIEERGYEFVDVDSNKKINLKKLGNKKVSIRHGNILYPLKFEDDCVSAIDATLVIHHAAAYKQNLVKICSEMYRVLEHGGFLHFGTGNVNMRHQEEKIHRIASEAQKFYDSFVALEDKRCFDTDSEITVDTAIYEKGKNYKEVPLCNKPILAMHLWGKDKLDEIVRVQVTKEGIVEIDSGNMKKAYEFQKYLASKGFKQVHAVDERRIVLPIIDPGMEEDRNLYLESVNNYYTQINALVSKEFSTKPDTEAKIFEAVNKEYGDAARGLFEYYTHPNMIMSILQDTGFRNVIYKPDNTGIWCSITAVKD